MQKLKVEMILLLLFTFCLAQWNDFESARSTGMGGVSVGLWGDPYSAGANPAAVFLSPRTQIAAGYTRLFAGLHTGGTIQQGNFYVSPYPISRRNNFSVAGDYLVHSIFSNVHLRISWVRRITIWEGGVLSGALFGDIYRVGYNLANAIYDTLHGDNPNDPLFGKGTNKIGFGGGIAFFLKRGPLAIGIRSTNINEPNMSISGDQAGKIVRKVSIGTSYTWRDIIVPALEFETPISSTITDQDAMRVSAGVEGRLFNQHLILRTGYRQLLAEGSTGTVMLGLGIRSLTKHNIGFDYALNIPSDRLSSMVHHRFAVIYGFPEPPPSQVDLTIIKDSTFTIPKIFRPDSAGVVSFVVKNVGGEDAVDFWVRTFAIDDSGKYTLVSRHKISKLTIGESMKLETNWTPDHKGYFDFYVSADDAETDSPKRKPELADVNPENNIISLRVSCFNSLSFEQPPAFLKTLLKLSQITYIREEIPMIPIVFFEHNDTTVPQRFYDLLSEIAERLNKNPNISIRIKGYVDMPTEKNTDYTALARNRANAVKTLLEKWGAPADRVIVVPQTEYDISMPKAGKKDRKQTGAFEKMIAEENRRAELETGIVEFPDTSLICCVNYRVNETELPDEGKLELENMVRLTEPLLENNPDIIILFSGMSGPLEGQKWDLAFYRALKVRSYANHLVKPDIVDRMMVYAEPGTLETVNIIMSADAILYRPRGITKAIQGFQMASDEKNGITIGKVNADAGIDSYYVSIVDSYGKEFRKLASGKDNIPEFIPWDWRGEEGEPAEPGKSYHAFIYIRDKVGQELSMKSEPAKITVTQEERRQELIIVNFTFGGTLSQSPYLEGRLERIASRFIENALEKKSHFKAIVGGHTDIIGSKQANERLSLQRAQKEERNFRKMILEILHMKDEKELSKWLMEHNVTLDAKGFGPNLPLAAKIWEKGYFREILLGNNEFPEGRMINRRVSIQYEVTK